MNGQEAVRKTESGVYEFVHVGVKTTTTNRSKRIEPFEPGHLGPGHATRGRFDGQAATRMVAGMPPGTKPPESASSTTAIGLSGGVSQEGSLERVTITESGLGAPDVVAVARHGAQVSLDRETVTAMERSASIVADLAAGARPVYGVSTGFGSLANTPIPAERREELQRSLIRSHAAGMGPEVEKEVIRAMMVLRVRSLASGFTGARPAVAETLMALLNHDVTPVVFEYGSLGASGDLAPLAHAALALIGEGEVRDRSGDRIPAAVALEAAGIAPVTLTAKEGLALINGTDGMLGMLLLGLHDLSNLMTVADITAGLSVEALLGTDRAFAADLQELRPYPGQAASAANLRAMLADSAIVSSHREGDSRVQDAYSLRCSPQVHGAGREIHRYATGIGATELGSAIDNPTVLPDGRVESVGNFHGAPVAHALDYLAIGVADLCSIAERRTDRLLDASRSQGLPPFLTDDPGVNSGLMIAQYTQAAMVAENRRLATPASVDSFSTSAMQEDHVSLGWHAGRKLRTAIDNLTRVLAIELVCAARGLDFRAPLTPGPAGQAARDLLRQHVPGAGPDRWLAPELAAAAAIVSDGSLVAAVSTATGQLQ